MPLNYSNLAPKNGTAATSALNSFMYPSFNTANSTPATNGLRKLSAPVLPAKPITAPTAPIAAAPSAAPVQRTTYAQPAASPVISAPSIAPSIPAPFTPSSTAAPATSSQSPSTTYGGLVGNLVQNTQPTAPFNSLANSSIAGLQGTAAQNPATSGQAYTDYNTAVKNLQDLKAGQAAQYGSIESQPIPLEFQQGREQALARQYASQDDAAQQAVNQQQQQIANQIAGTQTQQAGFNQAGSLALTGAGQVNSALGTAAGYAQPQVTSPGQAVFDPLTGTYTNASSGMGGGNATVAPSGVDQNAWNQYVHDFATGNMGAIPSSITGNANLAGQLQQAVNAQNPNFDYNSAVGAGAANAANANLSGTASPNAYNSIYQQALGDYTNLQQSVQNVDGFGTLLTSNMTAGGINPTDVKYANRTLAQIRGQLSSGAQAQYDTTLAALRSKISGMLSVGGNETPTAITADAQKILDGSLPLSSLNDVLNRIQTEGNILLQNQAQKVNTAKSGTQGQNAGIAAPSGGTTASGAKGWL